MIARDTMVPTSFYILRDLVFLTYFCEGYGVDVHVFVAGGGRHGGGGDNDEIDDDVGGGGTWFRGVVTLDCTIFPLVMSDEHLPRDPVLSSKCLLLSHHKLPSTNVV